jgi:hypothetical protein
MNGLAGTITSFFAGSGSLLAFLGTISAIGAVAMGLVQSIKDNTSLRRHFNRREVDRWLDGHVTTGPQGQQLLQQFAMGLRFGADNPRGNGSFSPVLAKEAANSIDAASAKLQLAGASTKAIVLEQLVKLAVDGEASSLYELEAEEMVSQIKAAFASAIDAPHRWAALVALASCFSEEADISEVLGGPPMDPNDKAARARYSDARTRVFQQFQRAADALRIKTAFRWRSLLQSVAFGACFALTLLILGGPLTNWQGLLAFTGLLIIAGITALLAAFFAPIARDVVAAVGQLRKL